jgi:succinoglycan biosynthesis protein ExoM
LSISVLIASMGRDSLAETLDSALAARVPEGETREIIVADDSLDGAVPRLIGGRFQDVRIVSVNAQNVSEARNACLEAAASDWLIFVDDDETVAEDWLDGHLSTAKEFEADAVFGPVHRIYSEQTPKWFRDADPMSRDWGWSETGRRIAHGRTGNTLIRRATVERLGLRFDPAFGRTGGEDDDFFRRMHALGGVMVVTDRANAFEMVPEERATLRYVFQRFVRFGQTYAHWVLRGAPPGRRFVFAAEAFVKLCIAGLGYALVRPFSRRAALRLLLGVASNRGKLSVARGGQLTSSWS